MILLLRHEKNVIYSKLVNKVLIFMSERSDTDYNIVYNTIGRLYSIYSLDLHISNLTVIGI